MNNNTGNTSLRHIRIRFAIILAVLVLFLAVSVMERQLITAGVSFILAILWTVGHAIFEMKYAQAVKPTNTQ